jgi:alkaline phosphatase D
MKKTFDDGYPENLARRRALSAAGGGAIAAALPLSTHAATQLQLALSPAVFDAHNGRAIVRVCANAALRVHVRWAVSANQAPPHELKQRTESITLSAESDFVGQIALTQLPSAAVIRYAVFADETRLSEVQQCRAAPLPNSPTPDFTLIFSGDTEERHRPFRLFDVMAKRSPDYFVHLGDTIYADIPRRDFLPTLKHYRRKHFINCNDAPWQSFASRVVTYATWDDHEIENDANREHMAKTQAQQAFREYWPCRSVTADGLYRRISLGTDVALFMLDTRAFRSPQIDVDNDKKTMLGAAQKRWFVDAFRQSRARFRLIASSVPFHGASNDAWGNYATERDELLAVFREAARERDAKTIVLSADYHFAREWPRNEKHGVFEFTAGPIASFLTFSRDNAARERNSRGNHFVYGDSENFGVLRYSAATRSLTLNYVDAKGVLIHQRIIA